MAFGYSNSLATHIKREHRRQKKNPVFAIGAICVENNIMLSDVAKQLGVSKQSVYKWMSGEFNPRPDKEEKITEVLARLRALYGDD